MQRHHPVTTEPKPKSCIECVPHAARVHKASETLKKETDYCSSQKMFRGKGRKFLDSLLRGSIRGCFHGWLKYPKSNNEEWKFHLKETRGKKKLKESFVVIAFMRLFSVSYILVRPNQG
ncbi:LOW QUALITY PROTEIN: hypothetical protein PanWU01x14_355800 [Parasponia andersonii]|uniref:Transmembrane protein n=1 Tax=Parasponia andersonii TaxID=3476 RepID=A0A2P5A952_PARAD|nr:LOW QUALITY PROTEIN: hypothetical protein PanWU01x14_355800 [Parasponia andersonii]